MSYNSSSLVGQQVNLHVVTNCSKKSNTKDVPKGKSLAETKEGGNQISFSAFLVVVLTLFSLTHCLIYGVCISVCVLKHIAWSHGLHRLKAGSLHPSQSGSSLMLYLCWNTSTLHTPWPFCLCHHNILFQPCCFCDQSQRKSTFRSFLVKIFCAPHQILFVKAIGCHNATLQHFALNTQHNPSGTFLFKHPDKTNLKTLFILILKSQDIPSISTDLMNKLTLCPPFSLRSETSHD